MKALLVIAGLAVATALVSGALLVGQGPGVGAPSPPAGPAPAGGAAPAPAAPVADDRAAIVDLEKRVRALEARLVELGTRADSIPPLPGASGPAPGAENPVREDLEAGASSGSDDADLPFAALERLHERVQVLAARTSALKESKRDAEIRRRIDRAVLAMSLTEQERNRVEEIARSHVERADAIALRAKEALKNSPFGFSEADRALVDQLSQDRARLDKETEQSLLLLIGAERWKAGLKADKDQDAKEKAVKRLEKPW